MLYLTCTTITSIDLAHYRVSRAKDWVSVKCGTKWDFSAFKMKIISIRKCIVDTDVINDVTRSRQSVITRVFIRFL